MRKAVALSYDNRFPAPFIAGRGKGDIANRIVEIAEKNGITILEKPELADILSEMELGTLIPEYLYSAIAEILAFVYHIRGTLYEYGKS